MKVLLRLADLLLVPLTFVGGIWLWVARSYGINKLPVTRWALHRIGLFPIRDHYYEPQFKFPSTATSDTERPLPGVDLNVAGQLELLDRFHFQEELRRFPMQKTREHEFCYENAMFGPGDAEYLYSLVRLIKPRRVTEIGCGFSTLMVRNAVNQNRQEQPDYQCLHTCIEPYENPWLEQVGVKVVRQRLETLSRDHFKTLEENDILFIDSSHMVRPNGDVLCEVLDILPRLKPGVYVHIHDIFTPYDYPAKWLYEDVRFWNEQYLVEAFLTENSDYAVVGALHFLSRRHPQKLAEKFPVLAAAIQHKQPGSLWLCKRK